MKTNIKHFLENPYKASAGVAKNLSEISELKRSQTLFGERKRSYENKLTFESMASQKEYIDSPQIKNALQGDSPRKSMLQLVSNGKLA
mmetsp:Transcript_27434/g.24314  ORF Transcript_27434/g.24314 Transcript_27434/m.24314 type:complete len:88 (-) Transcript_27434:523-786(-)